MKKVNKLEYDFLASSKVLRCKLGNKGADILAVLQYKFKHWESKGDLTLRKGIPCFYISYSDIREETTFGESVIRKNLKILIKADLITTFRQGLGKPNLYHINETKVLNYIKKYEKEYGEWREQVRTEKKGSTEYSEINKNQGSLNDEKVVLDLSKVTTTKNKSTKNKITKKKLTNHMNVAEYEPDRNEHSQDWCEKSEELERLIDSSEQYDDEERFKAVESVYNFLLELVPNFKRYRISDKDIEMVDELFDYSMYTYITAEKIITNAQRIINGDMESRFGNLFVGLREINNGIEEKYH